MNDPILKCLLMEVGKAITEVEYKAPRHEIVRVLDEASRSIAELGVSEMTLEPVKQSSFAYADTLMVTRLFRKYQEVLLVLQETNPDNVSLSVREWYDMNPEYFEAFFKVRTSPFIALTSSVTQLVRKGYMQRSYDTGSVSVCKLTPRGLTYVKALQQSKHTCVSDEYRKSFAGVNYAYSH